MLTVKENCSSLTVECDEKTTLNHFRSLLLSKDTFSEKFTFALPNAATIEPLKSQQLFFSAGLFPELLRNSSSGRQ